MRGHMFIFRMTPNRGHGPALGSGERPLSARRRLAANHGRGPRRALRPVIDRIAAKAGGDETATPRAAKLLGCGAEAGESMPIFRALNLTRPAGMVADGASGRGSLGTDLHRS